jgi:SAM-dependent methyltransferase
MDPVLMQRIRERVAAGGRVLVAGSGAGHECFALQREGWHVTGVDFSAEIVERARKEALRRGSHVSFHPEDLRKHREPPGSLTAVIFTYEAYGFIRGARDRVELLGRMRGWLAPEGCILLPARRVQGPCPRTRLLIQVFRSRPPERKDRGCSHTRWLSPDGGLSRSFMASYS